MLTYLPFINKILSLGIIFLQIFIFLLLVNFIFFRKQNRILSLLKKYTFHAGFFVSLISVLIFLFYSQIAEYYFCEFGYVTMPIMALTISLFILTILLNNKYTREIDDENACHL